MKGILAENERPLDPRLNWSALSQTERDAAYDNNAAVKNSAALIVERNEASVKLRASRRSFLDVAYGHRERTKVDLYPAANKTAPKHEYASRSIRMIVLLPGRVRPGLHGTSTSAPWVTEYGGARRGRGHDAFDV